jgi:hypothetical protein
MISLAVAHKKLPNVIWFVSACWLTRRYVHGLTQVQPIGAITHNIPIEAIDHGDISRSCSRLTPNNSNARRLEAQKKSCMAAGIYFLKRFANNYRQIS